MRLQCSMTIEEYRHSKGCVISRALVTLFMGLNLVQIGREQRSPKGKEN